MTSANPAQSITIHNRTYTIPAASSPPIAVVCIDGFDPTYLQHTLSLTPTPTPTLASMLATGFHTLHAHSAMPSLTNPNNLSIITGAPTAAHGVAGNYYLDRDTGEEKMVLDDALVRGTTILAELRQQGRKRIVAVTAKDKLRRILCRGLGLAAGRDIAGGDSDAGLPPAICFSAQCADECTLAEHGIEGVEKWLGKRKPDMYSGELSLFVLDAGVKLMREGRGDVFYLTLSDFVQHKYAPEEEKAVWFMKEVDRRLGELVELGALVVVTGDHGMSDKSDENGDPNVLFLEDVLNEKWPDAGARVICPIADPFVKHHGALGGFVRVHLLGKDKGAELVEEMVSWCRNLPEVELACTGDEAAKVFEMPADREGDLVVVSKKHVAIGGRKDEHDLQQLKGHRLRTHGGLSEQDIPLIASVPFQGKQTDPSRTWRNYDAFDVALNH